MADSDSDDAENQAVQKGEKRGQEDSDQETDNDSSSEANTDASDESFDENMVRIYLLNKSDLRIVLSHGFYIVSRGVSSTNYGFYLHEKHVFLYI